MIACRLVTFNDHFSSRAADYAVFRPRYPDALFEFLASESPARDLAWDCATGNGQAAIGLAAYFARVVATDASDAQIARAAAHQRVEYRVAVGDNSGLPDQSADLVTVAQALHWLDRAAFFPEARRVLVPGGLIAVWCYGQVHIEPAVDAVLRRFYSETVGPYWPPERPHVDNGYRTIQFPFDEQTTPSFAIDRLLTLDELAGYLRTWSATRRYMERHGVDPVGDVIAEVAPIWGDPSAQRAARWPLSVRVGRV